jgi:hypothetical protein
MCRRVSASNSHKIEICREPGISIREWPPRWRVRHLVDGQGRLELWRYIIAQDHVKAYKLVNEVTISWREL